MIDYMTSNKHEFRVGDRVRIIGRAAKAGWGTILYLEDEYARVLWDSGVGSRIPGTNISTVALELWPPILTIQEKLKRLVEA